MTRTYDVEEPRGIDPAGDVGLVLMALSQLGVAQDYRERILTATTQMQATIVQQAEQLAAAADEGAALQARLNSEGQESARLRNRYRAFQAQVRDLAIKTHRDEDWCLDGLNAALKELGLAEYEPRTEYEVTVQETGTREGRVTVEVDRSQYPSDEAAEEKARSLAYQVWANNGDIDWDNWDDAEAKDSDEWEVSEN
jgi:hypothetical protein